MFELDRFFAFPPSTARALALAASIALLPGCTGGGDSSTPVDDEHEPGKQNDDDGKEGPAETGYVAAGVVVDTQGNPLAGVDIFADNQFTEGSTLTSKTGTNGQYRIELPQTATTWHMSATHTVEYHGREYSFPLHPEDDSAFAGNTGGVRNFAWKLTGKRPDDGFYGAYVVGYTEVGDYSIDLRDVELTLVPDGPLVDGSTGETITGKLASTGDGDAIQDIPLGRYTITAREGDTALLVRIRNSGTSYDTSLTSDFDAPYGSLPIYNLEVELSLP